MGTHWGWPQSVGSWNSFKNARASHHSFNARFWHVGDWGSEERETCPGLLGQSQELGPGVLTSGPGHLAIGSIPTRTLGSSGRRDWHAPRAGPDQGSPDGAREVARAQGQEGEPQFIFSCLECASKPYLDIRRQSELEAAGAGEERAPLPWAPLTTALPCPAPYHPFWRLWGCSK